MTKNRTKHQTNRQLADKLHVDPRTIRNWRRAGAPLNNAQKLAVWLSGRKNIPPNVIVSLPVSDAAPDTTPERVEALGAAAALDRLQNEEVRAYSRLQKSLRRGDPLAIRVSRENWLRILNTLRQYESAVSAESRRQNALIPRLEVETHLRWLAYGCRVTSEGMLPELVQAIQGESCPIRARQIAKRCLWHAITAAEGFALLARVPRWMLESFSTDFQNYLGGNQMESMERFADALKEAAAAIPGIAREQQPPGSSVITPAKPE